MPVPRSSIRSASAVAEALDDLDNLDQVIADIREQSGLNEAELERTLLKGLIDKWVLDHKAYEDDKIKITRVQGFRRKWNVDKLESILSRALFKRVIKIEIDGQKLDDLVRAGTVDAKKLAPAFEEEPNAPYAKWTKIKQGDGGAGEAEGLAVKLG